MTDPARLTEHLKAALEAVDAAGVPDDLRETAFARALDFLLGAPAAAQPAASQGASPAADLGQVSDEPPGDMEKLARKLGVDVATAAKVFDIDDDGLHIVVAPSKFGGVMTSMEQIARLVVAGRQAGLDEEWTPISSVRAVCEDRGKYSQGNFATAIKKLDGDGFRIRGSGASRELKANATGFEKTGILASELAG